MTGEWGTHTGGHDDEGDLGQDRSTEQKHDGIEQK